MEKYFTKLDSFLYCWTDHKFNKLYIGIRKGSEDDGYICSSKIVLEEMNKRPNDFTRQIIAHGEYKDILQLETAVLKSVDAKYNHVFYNMHNGDGNFYNKQHSEETKLKMSVAAKGKIKSKEHIEKIIKSKTSKKIGPASEERKRKISEANKGKKRTEEQIKRISEGAKGVKRTEEFKENIRGRKWYNNGIENKMIRICPEGFTLGMLRKN